jgi:hypothetical protein
MPAGCRCAGLPTLAHGARHGHLGEKVSKIALDAQPGGNDEVDHPKADVFVAVNAQLIKNNGQIQ